MTVDRGKTAHHSEHGGTTYYFCGPGCKQRFDAAPEQFVSREDVASA
jgi:Cu+-exporting ATPase